MAGDTDIGDPIAEFTELPGEAQQELVKLYAAMELMLPEERRSCATTQAGIAETLEELGVFRLQHRVSIAIIRLLTAATLDEKAADEKAGL